MNESTEITLNNGCIGISVKPTDATDLACIAGAALVGGLTYVGLKKLVAGEGGNGEEGRPYA